MLIVLFENIGIGFDSLNWPTKLLLFLLVTSILLLLIRFAVSIFKRPAKVSLIEGGEILMELSEEEARGEYNFPTDYNP